MRKTFMKNQTSGFHKFITKKSFPLNPIQGKSFPKIPNIPYYSLKSFFPLTTYCPMESCMAGRGIVVCAQSKHALLVIWSRSASQNGSSIIYPQQQGRGFTPTSPRKELSYNLSNYEIIMEAQCQELIDSVSFTYRELHTHLYSPVKIDPQQKN